MKLNNITQKIRVLKKLPLDMSLAFLAFLSYQALFPSVPSNAATTDVELELEVAPTLEMALDKTNLTLANNGETDILPTSEGVQVTGDVNVYVTTNNTSGYRLSVYTQDPTQDMKHINSNVSASISPTSGGSTLATDTWGFQSNNLPGSWVAVGANEGNAAPVNTMGSATSSICTDIATNYESCYSSGAAEKNTVTFGANLTDALPSGRYTNDVVFSVVAIPNAVAGN
ncbi:hypothetical protein IKG73_01650 [Candidatus Saccharibacteria bacterium]|nr:hypothetical protein [Candidatus Saccharibacteria bacterium]